MSLTPFLRYLFPPPPSHPGLIPLLPEDTDQESASPQSRPYSGPLARPQVHQPRHIPLRGHSAFVHVAGRLPSRELLKGRAGSLHPISPSGQHRYLGTRKKFCVELNQATCQGASIFRAPIGAKHPAGSSTQDHGDEPHPSSGLRGSPSFGDDGCLRSLHRKDSPTNSPLSTPTATPLPPTRPSTPLHLLFLPPTVL